MSKNKDLISRLHNATDNLVDQQFYLGGRDIIIGRSPEIFLKIKFSGQIIAKFKELFNANLDLFLNEKYLQFIEKFAQIDGITKELIDETFKDLGKKLKNLEGNIDDSEDSTVILYTMLLSSIITKIREIKFEEVKKIIYRKLHEKNSSIKDSDIRNELNKLYQRNDRRISILYNISYMQILAKTFNYKQVEKVCNIQQTKFINKIVKFIGSKIS